MKAWRIVKKKYAISAFDGEGAFLYGGRWNKPGTRVVYLAGSPSLAALEIIVNTNEPDDLLAIPYVLIPVEFDPSLLTRVERLPRDWNRNPAPSSTADLGNAWFHSGRSLLLEVPSAVVRFENNYLLNPAHSDFKKITIGRPQSFRFDPRLKKRKPQ